MMWGAHEVDGRIAAKAAVKLRAALRQSIDAKRLFQLYKESDPLVTDNEAQDNARARAWAMINMLPNNQALINALMYLWAEAFILGEDSATDAIRQARELKKAPVEGVDWSNWKPGDRASALLITPPKAFQSLLSRSGVAIRGLDKTGYDRVGTALARSIRLGLGDTNAAKLINDAIGDPARALTIAITETNRAVSLGAMKTYREAGLEEMQWETSDPCPECVQNQGQIVQIGGTFNSGAQQPPAHPNCRCALLPVIPDYETNEAGVVDVAPTTGKPMPYALKPEKITSTFDDRFGYLPENKKAIAEQVLNDAYQEIAEQPIRINLTESSLEKIVENERFKSAFENPNYYPEYMTTRLKIETESIGVPKTVKPIERPIYGSNYGSASAYGKVEVRLKDAVKNRATMTSGDSFVGQNPVAIKDVLSGNASLDALAQATPEMTTTRLSGWVRAENTSSVYEDFKNSQTYWEVQIHGGVELSDIDSVILPRLPDGKWGSFRVDKDGQWSGPVIDKLKAKGIKIVQP